MRILVTGAAGFIGSHLVRRLVAGGHEVRGLDDLSTGRMSNLVTVTDRDEFELTRGSVLDAELVDRLTERMDVVYHLAAAVGAFVIRDRTIESLATNLVGTENVVTAAYRHGARLVLASTSEIYGKNDKIGITEDDDRILGSPLKSRWSYSEAKAIDESLVAAYVNEHGLRASIARLFNTVGPRQTGRYGMVIPRFVGQALRGEPITVFGTGQQIRCFCHVADVIPALERLPLCEEANGQAVNLGGSEPITIAELAGRVIAVTGSSSQLEYQTYEQAYGSGYEDMLRRIPDSTRAAKWLDFAPTYGIDDIIRAVADDQATAPAPTG